MIQTQAVSQRGIEIVGLTGDLHLLVRTHAAEGAHVVETVGKLDEKRTYIILHRRKDLKEIVYLLRLHILVLLLLGDHSHKKGYLVTEAFLDVLDGIRCILDHVVKEGRDHRIHSKLKFFRNDAGYIDRMDDVRLARLASLGTVGFSCEFKCITQPLQVTLVTFAAHPLEQFVNTALDLDCIVRFHRIQ